MIILQCTVKNNMKESGLVKKSDLDELENRKTLDPARNQRINPRSSSP
jgi:hypothetical protein